MGTRYGAYSMISNSASLDLSFQTSERKHNSFNVLHYGTE